MRSIVILLDILLFSTKTVLCEDSISSDLCDVYALDDDDVFRIWQMNDCNKLSGKRRPIYENTVWISMRKRYEETVGASKSSLSQLSSVRMNGFKINYSVKYNNDNERGIFSRQKIRKGQVIYEHRWLAHFKDSRSFIDFLGHLPSNLVCDAIELGYYFESIREIDHGWISIDLDHMIYCNDKGKPNIDYGPQYLQIIALRDIDNGEELIYNSA